MVDASRLVFGCHGWLVQPCFPYCLASQQWRQSGFFRLTSHLPALDRLAGMDQHQDVQREIVAHEV
jgi:hypothetical protein